jgi:hypothetical protein
LDEDLHKNMMKLLGAWKSAYIIKGPPRVAPVGGNDYLFIYLFIK